MRQCLYRLWPAVLIIATLSFNEYFIYPLKIGFTCSWPCGNEGCNSEDLRVVMIADTHILGVHLGHWLDKMKREWQMHRSFQSMLSLKPDTIFFLGDQMDEGKWSDERQFNEYFNRFNELFHPGSSGPPVHVVAGNHDLGFHDHIYLPRIDWFNGLFNRELVDLVTIKDQPFVLITSMSFHGDRCTICSEAESLLDKLEAKLNGSEVRPILLQHFPLYRRNDDVCVRDHEFDYYDSTRDEIFKPRKDSLSIEATKTLLNKLRPRAAFNGHTHRGCKRKFSKPVEMWEYTVNSFSWRNGDRPSFLMVTINKRDILVRTCFLPNESTTFVIYFLSIAFLIGYSSYSCVSRYRRRRAVGESLLCTTSECDHSPKQKCH